MSLKIFAMARVKPVQSCLAMPLDRHRPGLPVQWLVIIGVALQLLEIGQHVRPAPAMRADRCPFVIVVGRAAVGADAVDRRSAAQHPRLLVEPWLGGLVGAAVAARGLQRPPQPFLLEVGAPGIRRGQLRGMLAGVTSRPASHSSTRVAGSSLSRDASTQPAEPPPMMRKSMGPKTDPWRDVPLEVVLVSEPHDEGQRPIELGNLLPCKPPDRRAKARAPNRRRFVHHHL